MSVYRTIGPTLVSYFCYTLLQVVTGLLCKGVAVGGNALFTAATEGAGAEVGNIIQTGLYAGCKVVRKKVDACDKIPTKREVINLSTETTNFGIHRVMKRISWV